MSQIYNTLIRENDEKTGKSRIVGSTLITNKAKLPPKCILTYGNKQTNSETLQTSNFVEFASPTKPLQLYLDGIPEESNENLVQVFVRTAQRKLLCIPVSPQIKVRDLKSLLERKYEINSAGMRIMYGSELKDERTLADYNIGECSTLQLVGTGLGGGVQFSSVDLSTETIKSKGFDDGPLWLSFYYGVNLLGTCPNKNCVSNQSGRNGSVIRPEGNGHLILTPENNLVTCIACDEGQFTPKNFIVSRARSLFRFKKVGDGVEVKQRLLECTEESDFDYVMFNPSDSGANYDLIEVRTVGKDSSPFTCVKCAEEIGGKEEEKVLEGCKHAYHRACYDEGGSCSTSCNVAVAFWSEEEIERECEKQQRLKAEQWQRKFIQENLTNLTQNTICNTHLLNYLYEKRVLSSSDKDNLEIIQDRNKQVSKLYELIPSKVNGYIRLIEALQEGNQSMAVELLLEDGLRKNDLSAWRKLKFPQK